jgi:hypothetical protein
MASTYFILDTAHEDYDGYIADFSPYYPDDPPGEEDDLFAVAPGFRPRLSIDGSEAIIQIKDSYDTSGIAWVSDPGACVLSSGDVDWARAQVSTVDWTEEEE